MAAGPTWDVLVGRPTLGPHDVHVWRLDAGSTAADDFLRLLTSEERERALAFRFAQDRDRFAAMHAGLREILSLYLDCSPPAVEFVRDVHGKPALALQDGGGFHFSLSHSRDLGLVAVTRAGAVGIDLAFVREDLAFAEIAGTYFSD